VYTHVVAPFGGRVTVTTRLRAGSDAVASYLLVVVVIGDEEPQRLVSEVRPPKASYV
jgi:hypothetical protein